jgi:hypothetical protein
MVIDGQYLWIISTPNLMKFSCILMFDAMNTKISVYASYREGDVPKNGISQKLDSSTNKTDHHDITKLLLNVTLNTLKSNQNHIFLEHTLFLYVIL